MSFGLEYEYVVCDLCGCLWAVDSDEPDPEKCIRSSCKSKALWRFENRYDAEIHSATVKAVRVEAS